MHTKESLSNISKWLQKRIQEHALVIVNPATDPIMSPNGDHFSWQFDFRLVFSEKKFLESVSKLFWSQTKINSNLSFQIGGLESASLPLITALVLTSKNSSGFYIRKSRKKKAQMRLIEGTLVKNIDIILVDDLINSGSSFKKQIEVLKTEGYRVRHIFVIVQFFETNFYKFLEEEEITLHSLFTLSDFDINLPISRKIREYKVGWYFAERKPHLFEQGPKNNFLSSRGYCYKASDNGIISKLDALTGNVIWQRRVLLRTNIAKTSFTGLTIHNNQLYYSTYRGSLGVLSCDNGVPLFRVSLEHTFTTPLFLLDHHVISGFSKGSGKKRHGVLLFDVHSKHILFCFETQSQVGHSIVLDPIHKILFFAERNNTVYALDISGKLLWKTKCCGKNTGGVSMDEYGDILTLNEDGFLEVLNYRNGKRKTTHSLPAFHFSHPINRKGVLYGSTLDREVYCYDLKKRKILWSYETRGRMYSPPTIAKDAVYVGDTFGMLHVLNKRSGIPVGRHLVTERIVDPILVNQQSILVNTFANEIYSLSDTKPES